MSEMHDNKSELRNRIAAIVANKLSIDQNTITDKATLQELGADSLDLVEIILRLEEEFDIIIDDEKAADLDTFSQVVDYVQKLYKKQ